MNGAKCEIPLAICADLYGCPNRCAHCWIGHMPNLPMAPDADERIMEKFRPYFDTIEFYSWLREPDFCADYRARWERDKRLSVNCVPERFELASFWRLVRDPEYVKFLKEVGVPRVQLTFFGMEETTDRYIGRKGAFRELLRATEILLENGILPRWQAFINEENRSELISLLRLSEELRLKERCAEQGGEFRFFVHPGGCDGENRRLYGIRIVREHIPEELKPYFLDLDDHRAESEFVSEWKDDASHFVPHREERIVIYVSNEYDLFFNFTHMRPEWRIGNLKTDPTDELIRRIVEEDIPALNEAKRITLGELVRAYGDPDSQRAFEEYDYKTYLLNAHLEKRYAEDHDGKDGDVR